MSDYARIPVSFPIELETRKLLRRLGPAGPWAFVCLILWASKSGGSLSGMTKEEVEIASGWDGESGAFVKTLIECRLLICKPATYARDALYEIVGWSRYPDGGR